MRREVRLVEIMVLPERRGWGVGTATLDEILATAASAGKTGSIKRERNESRRDPALRTSGIR
jgi:GNAT superfamily N-acetyltransferase